MVWPQECCCAWNAWDDVPPDVMAKLAQEMEKMRQDQQEKKTEEAPPDVGEESSE